MDFVDRRYYEAPRIVPGYQVVGIVAQCGPEVTTVSVGDRVGVGYQVGSCGECNWCQAGTEQYCKSQRSLIVDTPGGFATHVRADERFVIPIPDELGSAGTAPLMCSGLTAYSAVQSSGAREGMAAAVVGFGGIGHFTSQALALVGVKVTAVTSKTLPDETSTSGIEHVVSLDSFLSGPPSEAFERVFLTTPMLQDLDPLLKALTSTGRLMIVGSPTQPVHSWLLSSTITVPGASWGATSAA